MNKKELKPYIPAKSLHAKGRTLDAVYLHFCQGLPVKDAAEQAGIVTETAKVAVSRIRTALLEDGYTVTYSRRVIYNAPARKK